MTKPESSTLSEIIKSFNFQLSHLDRLIDRCSGRDQETLKQIRRGVELSRIKFVYLTNAHKVLAEDVQIYPGETNGEDEKR